jgi:hypothetical protein
VKNVTKSCLPKNTRILKGARGYLSKKDVLISSTTIIQVNMQKLLLNYQPYSGEQSEIPRAGRQVLNSSDDGSNLKNENMHLSGEQVVFSLINIRIRLII